MAWLVRSILLFCVILTAGCSVEGMIERLTSREDRAFARSFVENVRTGNVEALKPEFDSGLWEKSREQFPQARTLFPPGKGETKLIGFNIFTNVTNGASLTRKEFTLVTTDRTHWTLTHLITLAEGGPARVVEWNVNGSKVPPPELEMYEKMERIGPWLQAGAIILLIGGGLLIFWLVRRSRRRAVARS
ncbi:MAG TPA: hypothetical protein VK472_05695 [Allosphingosinicella sp.]|nr:hypothetical protein [Allosphingosinicella sp.]